MTGFIWSFASANAFELAIAWPMAQGRRVGVFIVPIPGAKSRKHLEENVRAAEIANSILQ